MKILIVASEATPYSKTGGLADVIGALPPALAKRGEQVAVVLPGYRENVYPTALRAAYRKLSIPLGPGYTVDIEETTDRGVTWYFVFCPPLFDREGLYGAGGRDHPDNAIRFAVFSRAALAVARHLFRPDIIHCHDWQTALVPVYIRHIFRGDPTFVSSKILFTIHNLGYQGIFLPEVLPQIGLDATVFTPAQMEFYGKVNLMKGAIYYSDAISTVSRSYAREIQTPELGFGLDLYLKAHARRVTGIVNGVDYSEWSPENDDFIPHPYSAGDLSGKTACKRALMAEFGLASGNIDRPLIGIVSRLVPQKGFDLVAQIAHELPQLHLSMAVLGSGDAAYQTMFESLAWSHPDRFGVRVGYDNALAHKVEAGADMFLMPSHYEPCGLNQIYSLRYGTIPIVHATGGLNDTIDGETGFKFQEYSAVALLDAIRSAVAAFRDQDGWQAMMRRAMGRDFSWNAAAGEYSALYRELRAG